MNKSVIFFISLIIASASVRSQDFIQDLEIITDSANYSLSSSSVEYRRANYLYFVIDKPNEILKIKIIVKQGVAISKLIITPTANIIIIDSLLKIEDGSFTGTIQLNNFLDNPYSRLVVSAIINGTTVNRSIRIYPFIFPEMPSIEPLIEVFSGQEVRIPLPIISPYLLKYTNVWQRQGIVEFKLVHSETGPVLRLRTNKTGNQMLNIPVESSRPFLDEEGQLTFKLFDLHLNIRSVFSKVNYLNFDKQSYYFEPQGAKLISVQFDNNKNIRLNRTYRIEDQEKPGGRLIGELFTRAIIENQNKVVASLRTYALHRIEEGFLYMKLEDETKFFTNLNILKKPEVSKLSILRTAQDWNTSHIVYPGESIELKFEGVGLESSTIMFSDGKFNVLIDTSRTSEHVLYCTIVIPVDVKEHSIPIKLNGNKTAFELLVEERERPRSLDFVTINYGDGRKVINGEAFIKPALYKGEIGDFSIRFNEQTIDDPDRFYGIQYLEIEIRYWDKNKKLIESREIEDIKIVPGDQSLRYEGYNRSNASNPHIKLNDFMVNKTHELRPWSRIEITVKHDKSKYNGEGYSQHIQVYRSSKLTAGIEVSFPAGLLAKNLSEPGIGSLTGLSVASMAQFSFYKKNEINKINPLSVGVGFIFLNAFNSLTDSGEERSDIGIVTLLRFQPLRSESKVNFPIYAGIGYLFKNEAMFLLIGPGIQFNF